jgi:drug/metabolite transporter (DMT)-like permease
MALWGGAFPSSEVTVRSVPHAVAALLRFAGGALVLWLLVGLSRRRATPSSRPRVPPLRLRVRAALAGVVGVFVYNTLFFWGLSYAPAIDGTAIVPVLAPVLTAIALVVGRRETPSRTRAMGLCVGLAGAAVFVLGVPHGVSGRRFTGDLLFLVAAASWAAYTLLSPRALAGIEPLRATAYAVTSGAVLLAAMAAPSLTRIDWSALPAAFWGNVAYLAIGATAVGYTLYYRGVHRVGPATATTMMFCAPVTGVAASMAFLGESFGPYEAVGAAAMLVGAVLAVVRGRR